MKVKKIENEIRRHNKFCTRSAAGDTIVRTRPYYKTAGHSYKGQFEKSPDGWIYHTAAGYYDLAAGKHYWYLRDRLGSTVAVLDANGNYQQTTAYYPSGTPYQLPNATLATDVDASTDRLHIGNRWLSHSGLNWYDNTARMHDPVLMHFATPDPLYAKYSDLSPWSHCAANPLNAVDLNGKDIYSLQRDGTMEKVMSCPFIDIVGTSIFNFTVLDYGTIESAVSGVSTFKDNNGNLIDRKYTYYKLDSNGLEEFKFFAENTDVEWDRLVQSDGTSIVGTSNDAGYVVSGGAYFMNHRDKKGQYTDYNHSHIYDKAQSTGDVNFAGDLEKNSPNIRQRIFISTDFGISYPYNSKSKPEDSYEDGSTHMLEDKVVVCPKPI